MPQSLLFTISNTCLERLVFWQGSCHAALWGRDLPDIFSSGCDLGISSDSIGSCWQRCPKCPRALQRSTGEVSGRCRLVSWHRSSSGVGRRRWGRCLLASLSQSIAPGFSVVWLGCLLCPSSHAAHAFGHPGGIPARIVVIDNQLQTGQVGQAGEVADIVPVHIDHLQEGHVKQHRGEVGQQVAGEPDGPQLPEAPQLAWEQAQGVRAGMQSLQETELTDHVWQLSEAVGLDPQGPQVLEQAQFIGEIAEFVVAQVEDAELFQSTHHLGQRLEVVEIQGQDLQVL